ncbi:prolyl oligopeptidase family domain-containing protein [Ditylenchus destructor]|uniref:Prolyl oligopeptidase family domain-containing protein n=1 Tax=Ditylenchus destructor TaxID=166010 RepID=A0AAD4QRH5_9BILA|nr:prolyl oligopeptidase family domain-containing protein [Ditylenchus destructor]
MPLYGKGGRDAAYGEAIGTGGSGVDARDAGDKSCANPAPAQVRAARTSSTPPIRPVRCTSTCTALRGRGGLRCWSSCTGAAGHGGSGRRAGPGFVPLSRRLCDRQRAISSVRYGTGPGGGAGRALRDGLGGAECRSPPARSAPPRRAGHQRGRPPGADGGDAGRQGGHRSARLRPGAARGGDHRFLRPTDLRPESLGKWRSPSVTKWIGEGPDAPALAERMSPLTLVRKGQVPVFIVHGDADNVVPIQSSRQLKAALDRAGVPSELHIVPGGGHGKFGEEAQARLYADALRFLERHRITR